MYGLLLEGVRSFILKIYGEDMWLQVLKKAEIETEVFQPDDVYSEGTIERIVEAASNYLKIDIETLMFDNGVFFVTYLIQYGYDAVLKVLGRNLRDFLNGLDNMHEYIKLSYSRMKPPSFFCVNESVNGLTLQYRSRRVGYVSYVRGMITEIGHVFYNCNVDIKIVNTFEDEGGVRNVIMRLGFRNGAVSSRVDNMPVPSGIFFDLFPFNIVFNRGMTVISIGDSMNNAVSDLVGSGVNERFVLARPLIEFVWNAVMLHLNNVFELVSVDKITEGHDVVQQIVSSATREGSASHTISSKLRKNMSGVQGTLKIKGQMKYMEQWDAIIFLGTPILRDVHVMAEAGLFLNDLCMHDSSRDLVLAGEQQSAELKMALEQEKEKGKQLEESLKKLDDEMRRSDELLYQMIPKQVAEKLRDGGDATEISETYTELSIIFTDVVGFTTISSNIQPLQVVTILNSMYSAFDNITEKHKVYKVETIGDAYMIVSGCPKQTDYHAALCAETSLDLVQAITKIEDHSRPGEHIKIRVGIHTGSAVAGVVGLKMPRYCLFGDTVTTANLMEAKGIPQKVHISDVTKKKLDKYRVYKIKEREGTVNIPGRGDVITYIMEGRPGKEDAQTSKLLSALEREKHKLGDNISQLANREDWEELSVSRAESRAHSAASKAGSIAAKSKKASVAKTETVVNGVNGDAK